MKIEYELAAVLSAVVKTFACKLTRIQCSYAGGADGWVQFFDAKALPANGANPKFELKMFAGSVRFDEFTDLSFSTGCVIAVSTTAAVLTIASAGAELTGLLEGETPINDTGWLTTGDYTTADAELQVWADAAGPKFLMRLEITNLTDAGADRYISIRPLNSGTTYNAVAMPKPVIKIGATSSLDLFFGSGGYSPFGLSLSGLIAYGPADGCTVDIGTYNSDTMAFVQDASPNYAIKASYKETL